MHNDRVLTIEGYNAQLFVERGHLVTRDGFASEGKTREIRFPRGRCSIERIVIRAPGGTVSMEAIDWCARMGIAVSFVASDSTLLNCMVPDAPHDGPVKRAQAVSAVTDDAVNLARYLLGKETGLADFRDRTRLSETRNRERLREVHGNLGNPRMQSVADGNDDACGLPRAGGTCRTSLLESPSRDAAAVATVGTQADTGALGGDLVRGQTGDANGYAMRPIRSTRS